jgi:hypothetical protein
VDLPRQARRDETLAPVHDSAANVVGQVFNLPWITRQVQNLPHALLRVQAHWRMRLPDEAAVGFFAELISYVAAERVRRKESDGGVRRI